MSLLLSKRVDGIILSGSQFVNNSPGSDNSYIIDASSEIPIILVNGYLAGDNIYCVMCNDHDAVYNAASDMIKAGHRDFVYLYTSTSFSGMNKLRGFKDAMDEAGIHIDKDRFHLCTKAFQNQMIIYLLFMKKCTI